MELNGGVIGSVNFGAKKRIDMKNFEDGGGEATDFSKCDEWTQTGYTSTVVGLTVYSLIVLSFWIIQFLLFALTVEYCEYLFFISHHCDQLLAPQRYCLAIDTQQEAITWSVFGTQQFFDEVQVLMAFEIVWMVGFVWSFFIMAPDSLYALFLRSEFEQQYFFQRDIAAPSFFTHQMNML